MLRRTFASRIIEHVEMRGVRQIGFADADKVGKRILALFDEGAYDVCTLFYSTFKSVISQIPTAQRLIPAEISDRGRRG